MERGGGGKGREGKRGTEKEKGGRTRGERGGQRKGRKGDSREGPKRGSRVITGCFHLRYYAKDKKRITPKSLYKIIEGRHGWNKVYCIHQRKKSVN